MPPRALPQRLIWLAMFIGVVVAGDRLLAQGLSRTLLHTRSALAQSYRGGVIAPVLVVGNSRAKFGLPAVEVERRAGAPAFNLSVNGASMELLEVLLFDYLDKNGAPEQLILEIAPQYQPNNHLAAFTPWMAWSPRLAELVERRLPETAAACRVSHLYAYNSDQFRRSLGFLGRSEEEWVLHGQISPHQEEVVAALPPRAFEHTEANRDALGRIAAGARERGVRLRLVLAPFLPAYRQGIVNLEAWLAEVRAAAGVERVWDYSGALDETRWFRDQDHLNEEGTRVFLDRLERDGFFRDGVGI